MSEQKLTRAISVIIPIRTVSEANSHEHWRHRQKRAKAQRRAAQWTLIAHEIPRIAAAYPRQLQWVPCVVTLTRLSPRPLDDDNLQGALKHVRDGVADALGVDDRDQRVEWRYSQERTYAVRAGKWAARDRLPYAVRIEIASPRESASDNTLEPGRAKENGGAETRRVKGRLAGGR